MYFNPPITFIMASNSQNHEQHKIHSTIFSHHLLLSIQTTLLYLSILNVQWSPQLLAFSFQPLQYQQAVCHYFFLSSIWRHINVRESKVHVCSQFVRILNSPSLKTCCALRNFNFLVVSLLAVFFYIVVGSNRVRASQLFYSN